MADTYNKIVRSITVTTLSGNTVTAEDTANSPVASQALAEFMAGDIMHIPGEEATILIPFHAVESVAVTTDTTEVTKADPYGCGE